MISRNPSPLDKGGIPSEQSSVSRSRAFLFKIILLSLPFLLLLLLEGFFFLRFRSEYPNSTLSVQGKYRFVAAPYRIYGNNPGYIIRRDGIEYRYNNCGFRDERDLGRKGPNEFRVFLMGGSAAYGTEAFDGAQHRLISGQGVYTSSQTIAGHLQELLRNKVPHRDIKVFNAAVPNYSLQHVFLEYLSLVRLLSPDLIVTMDGWNEDFTSANPYGRAIPVHEKSGPEWINALRSHSYSLYYLGFSVARLLSRRNVEELDSAGFSAIDIEMVRRDVAKLVREKAPEPQVLDELMKVYESFWHATQLDGVPILFAVQPVTLLDSTKLLTPEEEKMIKYIYWTGQWWQPVGVAHLAKRLEAKAAKDRRFHFLNLLTVFENYPEPAYTDYCHITPGGNRHIAQRLAEQIGSLAAWTDRASSHQSSLPMSKERLGVDLSCGGL